MVPLFLFKNIKWIQLLTLAEFLKLSSMQNSAYNPFPNIVDFWDLEYVSVLVTFCDFDCAPYTFV